MISDDRQQWQYLSSLGRPFLMKDVLYFYTCRIALLCEGIVNILSTKAYSRSNTVVLLPKRNVS